MRLLAALAALALIGSCAAVAQAAANKNKSAAKRGVSWMKKRSASDFGGYGFEADAISAFAAARKANAGGGKSSDDKLVSDLSAHSSDFAISAGAIGKMLLASIAAGENPRCFGGVDLVALEQDYYQSGRYGDTAFDHAFAVLGLVAARQRVPSAAKNYMLKHRGKHGWNFALSKSTGDDVESTALTIEALRALGVKKSSSALQSAYAWMRKQRNGDGGYNPTAVDEESQSAPTQANTTAYAIRAADALDKNLGDAKRALRALQTKNGSFRSTPQQTGNKAIATSDAVLALSGFHYPVTKLKKAPRACV